MAWEGSYQNFLVIGLFFFKHTVPSEAVIDVPGCSSCRPFEDCSLACHEPEAEGQEELGDLAGRASCLRMVLQSL